MRSCKRTGSLAEIFAKSGKSAIDPVPVARMAFGPEIALGFAKSIARYGDLKWHAISWPDVIQAVPMT